MEDTYLCTSWFLLKSAILIEQTTKPLKILSLFLFHVLVSYERCPRVNDGNVKNSIFIFMKLTKLKLTSLVQVDELEVAEIEVNEFEIDEIAFEK